MEKPNTSSSITTENPSTCSKNSNNISSSDSKIYKGVRKRKWGKWVSEIRLPNSRERIWLGSHDTQEKAARAFDAALYCLRGRNASFNFPDTPLNINVASQHSFSSQEIQEIAAKFANETPMEITQGDEEQEQEQVVPIQEIGANCNNSTSTYSSCPIYDNDGAMQVDLRTMDRTFSDMFDDLNGIGFSDFGHYYEKMEYSGELLYSNQFYEDNNRDQSVEAEDDAFSNHSFLWSWNF